MQWPSGRLQLYSQPSNGSAMSMSCLTDSALDMDNGRQEAAEMRRLVAGLRSYLPPSQVVGEAMKLLHMLQSSPEKRAVFLAEGGVVALVELVHSQDLRVMLWCTARHGPFVGYCFFHCGIKKQ